MYSYQTPPEEERQYRLHLRVEHDGNSLLIINAATVLHLNQTASEYAYHLIEGTDPETVVNVVSKGIRSTGNKYARTINTSSTESIP